MDKYSYIANSDGAYIEELYNSYKQDPGSVDAGWQKFFEGYDFYQKYPLNGHANGAAAKAASAPGQTAPASVNAALIQKDVKQKCEGNQRPYKQPSYPE